MSTMRRMPASRGYETRAFTTRLPIEDYEGLKALAFYRGTTMADLVIQAVRALLAEQAHNAEVDAMVERTKARFRETVERLGRPEP